MSTDFRGREGAKSESGVNDHTVNRPKLPRRDRTRSLELPVCDDASASEGLDNNSRNYMNILYST